MLVHGVSVSKIDQAAESSDEEVLLLKNPLECDVSKDYEDDSLNSSAAVNELTQEFYSEGLALVSATLNVNDKSQLDTLIYKLQQTEFIKKINSVN